MLEMASLDQSDAADSIQDARLNGINIEVNHRYRQTGINYKRKNINKLSRNFFNR